MGAIRSFLERMLGTAATDLFSFAIIFPVLMVLIVNFGGGFLGYPPALSLGVSWIHTALIAAGAVGSFMAWDAINRNIVAPLL